MATTSTVPTGARYSREIVELYDWFISTGEKQYGEITEAEFMALVAAIGANFNPKIEDRGMIVEMLRAASINETTAGIPANLETLVREFDLYKEAKIKGEIESAKTHADLLKQQLKKLEQTTPEVRKVVYQFEQERKVAEETARAADKFVRELPIEQTIEGSRPTIPVWMEQSLENKVVGALHDVKIPENRINEIKEALVERVEQIKESGVQPTQQELDRTINEIVAKTSDASQPKIVLPEAQIKRIEETVLPEIRTVGGAMVYSAFEKSPRPTRRVTTPKDAGEQPAGQSPLGGAQNKKPELSTSSRNILFMLTERRLENVVVVQNQILGKSAQEQNREQLETVLFFLQSHEPEYYKANQNYYEQVRQLVSAQELTEKAQFIPANQLQNVIHDVDAQTKNLFRLDPSSQNNSIIAVPQSINLWQRHFYQMERQAQFEAEAFRNIPEYSDGFRLRPSAPSFQNLSFLNRGLNFLGKGFNLKGTATSGATRGLSSLFSLGGLAKNGIAGGLRSLGTMLAGLAAPEAVGAGLLIAVFGILFVGIFYFTYKSITDTHSLWVGQITSVGIPTQSQYFSLIKTVTPASYQGQLPTTVKYSVLLSAKEKNLTNIVATDVFTAVGEKNPPTPSVPSPSIPSTLEAGKSVSVEFPLEVGTNYNNSVIINTFTVTADVDGGPKAEKSIASANLIIGVPNIGCFTMIGTNWPPGTKEQVITAVSMLSKFPVYMASICKDSSLGPNALVDYDPGNPGYGGIVHGNRITLTSKAFDLTGGRSGCAFYTIAHETGHVYANKNSDIYTKFRHDVNPPAGEAYITSYVFEKEPPEDFAESIAMYIKRTLGDFTCSGNYTVSKMETISPLHYNFWKDYIK